MDPKHLNRFCLIQYCILKLFVKIKLKNALLYTKKAFLIQISLFKKQLKTSFYSKSCILNYYGSGVKLSWSYRIRICNLDSGTVQVYINFLCFQERYLQGCGEKDTGRPSRTVYNLQYSTVSSVYCTLLKVESFHLTILSTLKYYCCIFYTVKLS